MANYRESVKQFFRNCMVDGNEFTDMELETLITFCQRNGIENSFYTSGSFRNAEFHYLTASDDGNKMVKCSSNKKNRKVVSKDNLISVFGLSDLYTIFKKKEVKSTNTNIKNVTVYSSGHPNYFTYGFDHDTNETYCLISNQYWVRASQNFTETEILRMSMIQSDVEIVVN